MATMHILIPGFYYDTDKRKYFKILPNAAGSGSAAFYTADRVSKKIRGPDKTSQDDPRQGTCATATGSAQSPPSLQSLQQLGALVRQNTRRPTLHHMTCMRELGSNKRHETCPREFEAAAFCAGLRRTMCIRTHGRTDTVGVTCMDLRRNAQGLDCVWVGDVGGIYKEFAISRCMTASSYVADMTTPFAEFSGPVTATTQTSKFGLVTAECLNKAEFNAMLWTTAHHEENSTCYRIRRFRVDTDAKYLAASEESGNIAIGGSNRIMSYNIDVPNVKLMHTYRLPSDVFAIEYWQPSVFLAGLRDGSIRIFDTRVAPPVSTTSPRRDHDGKQPVMLWHPSAVTKMTIVKDSYLLVSGLQDSLSLYDMRNAKTIDACNKWQRSQSASPQKRAFSRPHTQPVLNYAGYTNDYIFDHAFDVSRNSNMLVVSDQSRKIKLYSVWSGQQLSSPLSRQRFDVLPRVAKWSNAPYRNDGLAGEICDVNTPPEGLFVTNGARLDYWSWDTRVRTMV
ncbi:uncharacterized protein V1518DRAFT_423845 [Limtongia smithiae]|uniref:uncharacterized protein n=1 Tax=Limtongia smithiae TaxID=1125753 RepID=UPI0034CF30DA